MEKYAVDENLDPTQSSTKLAGSAASTQCPSCHKTLHIATTLFRFCDDCGTIPFEA